MKKLFIAVLSLYIFLPLMLGVAYLLNHSPVGQKASYASTTVNQSINFAYEICIKAEIEDCCEIHERWLPNDVLAEELLIDCI